MTLFESATINLVIEFVYKLLALLILWVSLRALERYNGRPWSNTIARIENDPLALAVYQSALWLGCALVLAA
ncbi:hypothetical protein [Pseudodesulfovibrio pelocollis]|jgi:hypothetical protein|uniref:hypothetical protein n=1 Tax=Pseudodesulfovibrio pelocollis TaxID=3051432 RepID=UPI00255ADE73|nr:hypothetical protein [Pseudodesulfovibrio sp. SB368]